MNNDLYGCPSHAIARPTGENPWHPEQYVVEPKSFYDYHVGSARR